MTEDPALLERTLATARDFFSRDRASQLLGIELETVRPGFAQLNMAVTEAMVNGFGFCHGGILFMLADSAFAYSSNSHDFDAVAAGCTIEFFAAAQVGDRLRAVAEERLRAGRSGLYDVAIYNQADQCLAAFRGKSLQIRGSTPQKPKETE